MKAAMLTSSLRNAACQRRSHEEHMPFRHYAEELISRILQTHILIKHQFLVKYVLFFLFVFNLAN